MSTILTRQELISGGVTPGTIKAALRHGRWQRLNEHVVCTHTGTLTLDEVRQAVVASCSSLCALAGLTATSIHGVRGFDADEVHVLINKSSRILPIVGIEVVVHEVRQLARADVFRRRGFPVTGIARSLVDAAVWSPDARTGARILAAGVQQRRVRARDLEREAGRRQRMRHGGALRPFLADLVGGAQALSEVGFLRFCRRHGFPRPRLNVRNDAHGGRRYLDAEFRRPCVSSASRSTTTTP